MTSRLAGHPAGGRARGKLQMNEPGGRWHDSGGHRVSALALGGCNANASFLCTSEGGRQPCICSHAPTDFALVCVCVFSLLPFFIFPFLFPSLSSCFALIAGSS